MHLSSAAWSYVLVATGEGWIKLSTGTHHPFQSQVIGPLYRNRLEASERQARMPRGSKNFRRHKHLREQASKRAVKGGPGSKSLQSTSSSASTLPARKPAKDGGGSRSQSSRSHSTLPTPGSAPGQLSRKESALKLPLIESGSSIR